MVKYDDLNIGDLVSVDFIFGFVSKNSFNCDRYICIVIDKFITKRVKILFFNKESGKLDTYVLASTHPHWNMQKI